MLWEHGEKRATQVITHYIVKTMILCLVRQYIQFKEDTFELSAKPTFLIPTAEVPLTNYYRDEKS